MKASDLPETIEVKLVLRKRVAEERHVAERGRDEIHLEYQLDLEVWEEYAKGPVAVVLDVDADTASRSSVDVLVATIADRIRMDVLESTLENMGLMKPPEELDDD